MIGKEAQGELFGALTRQDDSGTAMLCEVAAGEAFRRYIRYYVVEKSGKRGLATER